MAYLKTALDLVMVSKKEVPSWQNKHLTTKTLSVSINYFLINIRDCLKPRPALWQLHQ